MSWLNKLVNAYSESEAPELFFYWAGLSAISATVRKNVYLDRYSAGKLYPNIFVFLVADSGMRKGVAVVMAKNLLKLASTTRIISGRSSMPAIIRDLSKAYTLENGGIVRDAQGIVLSGELASFLVKDPDALTILTDLFNTHEHEDFWSNSLKSTPGLGVEKLLAPYIVLLGATNEEHFPAAVPANSIGGGFIARTFIVYSREGGVPNSQTEKPKEEINLKCHAEYLRDISTVRGKFVFSPEGKEIFDAWYYEHKKNPQRDPTGTLNRLDSQILKVAMLLSLSSGDSLVLSADDISEAIAVCKACVIGMKQVTLGNGKSSTSYQVKLVLKELMTAPDHTSTRKKLLQHYWGDFDAFDLDKVIETLLGAGAIEVRQSGQNSIYVLKRGIFDEYNSFRKQIM